MLPDSQAQPSSEVANEPNNDLAPSLAPAVRNDPDLAVVMAAWRDLPDAVKTEILETVRAAYGNARSTGRQSPHSSVFTPSGRYVALGTDRLGAGSGHAGSTCQDQLAHRSHPTDIAAVPCWRCALSSSLVRKPGFSLVELVIVAAIIGVIAAIAVPRVSRGASGASEAAV